MGQLLAMPAPFISGVTATGVPLVGGACGGGAQQARRQQRWVEFQQGAGRRLSCARPCPPGAAPPCARARKTACGISGRWAGSALRRAGASFAMRRAQELMPSRRGERALRSPRWAARAAAAAPSSSGIARRQLTCAAGRRSQRALRQPAWPAPARSRAAVRALPSASQRAGALESRTQDSRTLPGRALRQPALAAAMACQQQRCARAPRARAARRASSGMSPAPLAQRRQRRSGRWQAVAVQDPRRKRRSIAYRSRCVAETRRTSAQRSSVLPLPGGAALEQAQELHLHGRRDSRRLRRGNSVPPCAASTSPPRAPVKAPLVAEQSLERSPAGWRNRPPPAARRARSPRAPRANQPNRCPIRRGQQHA